jgi:hypothetical protein
MSTITTEKIRISFAPTNSVCKENDKPYVKKSSIKISYGKPSKQIKIENVNDENNIRTINKTLHHSDIISMKKIDLNDLFKLKSISYASTKDKSLNDESTDSVSTDSVSTDSVSSDSLSTDSVSSDSVSSDSLSTDSVSTDSVSSDSVSSDSVPPKDEPSKDESNEVKLIKCLLLKVQNLEKVLINTGNGNKDELQSISKSISSLTDKLKTIV